MNPSETFTEDQLLAADVEKDHKKAAGTWLRPNVTQIIEAEQREARALGYLR